MTKICVLFLVVIVSFPAAAQTGVDSDKHQRAIKTLIDQYSLARENRDTVLLKRILTADIDQLVSSGEWRRGIAASVTGMLKSSSTTPGTRTLTIDKIRMLQSSVALVDCLYQIENSDGTKRKMWSSFVVTSAHGIWKISAIRNMLPSN